MMLGRDNERTTHVYHSQCPKPIRIRQCNNGPPPSDYEPCLQILIHPNKRWSCTERAQALVVKSVSVGSI